MTVQELVEFLSPLAPDLIAVSRVGESIRFDGGRGFSCQIFLGGSDDEEATEQVLSQFEDMVSRITTEPYEVARP